MVCVRDSLFILPACEVPVLWTWEHNDLGALSEKCGKYLVKELASHPENRLLENHDDILWSIRTWNLLLFFLTWRSDSEDAVWKESYRIGDCVGNVCFSVWNMELIWLLIWYDMITNAAFTSYTPFSICLS